MPRDHETDREAAARQDDPARWARHVRVSTVPYLLCCGAIYGYLAATHDAPRRMAIALVVTCSLAAVLVVDRLRWHIARSPHRMRLLYGWSGLTVVLVTAVSWLDGATSSPLCLLLFIALNHVALAYPPRAVLGLSGVAVAAYLLLAATGDDSPGWARLLVSTAVIGLSGFLGSLAARNHRAQTDAQHRLSERLAALATQDHLTGCLNRRAFDARLVDEVDRARRKAHPLSLLLVDVDHFKEVHDNLGHLAGDDLLGRVCGALTGTCRSDDAIGRIGGGEFALLLPDTTGAEGAALAQRLRVAVRRLALPTPVTLSIGVAQLDEEADTGPLLFQAAGHALGEARSGGRDRVAAASH